MRYRITVRADDMELRGYIDGEDNFRRIGQALDRIAPVIASIAEPDYNPFKESPMMTMTMKLGLDEANIVRDALANYRERCADVVDDGAVSEENRVTAARTIYTIEMIERQMGVIR
jgi:hypothetical protein